MNAKEGFKMLLLASAVVIYLVAVTQPETIKVWVIEVPKIGRYPSILEGYGVLFITVVALVCLNKWYKK
jgi:hypothetical protein